MALTLAKQDNWSEPHRPMGRRHVRLEPSQFQNINSTWDPGFPPWLCVVLNFEFVKFIGYGWGVDLSNKYRSI